MKKSAFFHILFAFPMLIASLCVAVSMLATPHSVVAAEQQVRASANINYNYDRVITITTDGTFAGNNTGGSALSQTSHFTYTVPPANSASASATAPLTQATAGIDGTGFSFTSPLGRSAGAGDSGTSQFLMTFSIDQDSPFLLEGHFGASNGHSAFSVVITDLSSSGGVLYSNSDNKTGTLSDDFGGFEGVWKAGVDYQIEVDASLDNAGAADSGATGSASVSLDFNAVPEPASLAMLALGVPLLLRRRGGSHARHFPRGSK
jgi:hypothetical protein